MTPINATDMQRCGSQHKSHIPSIGVQLRTPSSFAVKGPHARHLYGAQNKQSAITATNNNEISSTKEYNCTLDNVPVSSNIARSQSIEGKLIDESFQCAHDTISVNEKDINSKLVNSSILTHLAEQEIVSACERHTTGNYVSYGEDIFEGHRETLDDTTLCIARPDNSNDETAESMLADALLPPSVIHVNDIIGSTLDEKGLTFIREKLADKYNVAENPAAMHAIPKSFRPLDANDILYPRGGGAKENNNLTNIDKHAEKAAIIAAMKNSAESPAEKTEMGSPLEAERKMYKPLSQIVESTVVPASANINERKRCCSLANNKAANNDPLVMDTSKAIMESTMDPFSNKHNYTDPIFPILNLSTQTPDSQNLVAKSNLLQVELSSSVLQSSVINSEQLQNQVFPHIVGGFNEQRVQYAQLTDCLKDSIENLKIDSTKVQKCEKCNEDIHVGDVVVIAEKANNASWHPGCFVCSVCNELLVDLVHFYYKNKLYCGRDLAAFLGIPRCFACDEVSVRRGKKSFIIITFQFQYYICIIIITILKD